VAFLLVPIIGSLLNHLTVKVYFTGSSEKPEILLSTKRWQGRILYTGTDKNIFPDLKKKHLNGSK
jgi:hypothetical protein